MCDIPNYDNGKYPLIENPFVKLDSFVKPRLSLAKEPIHKIGNTDYSQFIQYDNGVEINNELDPKLNFFIAKEIKEVNVIKDEYLPVDESFLDYNISAELLNNMRTDGKAPHKDPLPISFLQIKNEEEGLLWYRKHYPKIPDDLLPIIARYHWGNALNKRNLKKERNRNKQNKTPQTLQIKKAEKDEMIKVHFD